MKKNDWFKQERTIKYFAQKPMKKTLTQKNCWGKRSLKYGPKHCSKFQGAILGNRTCHFCVRGGSDSDEPLERQMDSDGTTCNTE